MKRSSRQEMTMLQRYSEAKLKTPNEKEFHVFAWTNCRISAQARS